MNLFTRPSLSLGVALAALAIVPAGASAAAAPPAPCSPLSVSQPFLSWSDSNYYSEVPGQTGNKFVGQGWKLSGGASIVSTVQADGTTGTVLNLPSGAVATSPQFCVSSDYPTARTMVRNVVGTQGLTTSVSYDGVNYQSSGSLGITGTAWTLSKPWNIKSGPITGYQLAQFQFAANNSTSQIYSFWVDPRMSR
jgi:hypothetical protein